MKVKTSELEGAALDWAVAKCEGVKVVGFKYGRATFIDPADDGALNETLINYSTDWAQGGPIIEREGISICNLEANSSGVEGWTASMGELWSPQDDGLVSATPLIAAMRAYVASKLGDEVEIPAMVGV